jgi:hypothetical protein
VFGNVGKRMWWDLLGFHLWGLDPVKKTGTFCQD